MVHPYPDYFVVGREKVRECSRAVRSADAVNLDEKPAAELGHPAIMAPLTFTAVYALLVRDIVVTRNVCTNDQDELVLEAFTPLTGQQAEQSVKINGM